MRKLQILRKMFFFACISWEVGILWKYLFFLLSWVEDPEVCLKAIDGANSSWQCVSQGLIRSGCVVALVLCRRQEYSAVDTMGRRQGLCVRTVGSFKYLHYSNRWITWLVGR